MNTYKYCVETADGDFFEFDNFEKCIIETARMIKCDIDVMWIEYTVYDKDGNIVETNLITN